MKKVQIMKFIPSKPVIYIATAILVAIPTLSHAWQGNGWHGGGWGYGYGAAGFALGLGVGALAAAPYYNNAYYGGYYGGYPYPGVAYAYPPQVSYVMAPVSAPAAAPAQVATASQSSTPAVWYFCEKTNAYYPYVNSCAEGWKTVPALPPKNP